MAKPILIIKLPLAMTDEQVEKTKNLIQERLKEEYHVVACSCLAPGVEVKFECVGFPNTNSL
jgi:hypothetical protein